MNEPGPGELADRFRQQATACGELGSELYLRLLNLLADDISGRGATWEVLAERSDLRFGQAAPLRLLGAAHRLALSGEDPQWASNLPSCGGSVPDGDDELAAEWQALVRRRHTELAGGLDREVQTNEVGRCAGLALAAAEARISSARLVEIGCSGGLNMRFDQFEVDLAGVVLGHAESRVHLRPEMRSELGGLRHRGLSLPVFTERVGLDPHPVDPTTEEGRLTLTSFLWPDQLERIARVEAAIEVARRHPAEQIVLGSGLSTSQCLADVLARGGPAIVMHSVVWQYIPTDERWRVTERMEEAGSIATTASPLAWIRYEPDPWDRRRAAVWLRQWPTGGDRLVAHVDYHGRWLEPR